MYIFSAMQQYLSPYDRGSAHESTIISQTGQRVPNPLHYTFHFKNDTLADEAKHFCAHANVELDPRTKKPINWYNTMLKPKRESDGRTPAIDPDQYFDQKKQKMWNKWDQTLNEITVFTEKDVEGWVLGDNFIAHFIEEIKKLPLKAQNEIREDQERSKRETEEAISKEAVGLKKS